MPKVKISKDSCKGCKLCIVHCPKGKLILDPNWNKLGFHAAVFNSKDKQICSGCRFCVLVCPEGCVEVIKDEQKR